jgi:hypothetical protein
MATLSAQENLSGACVQRHAYKRDGMEPRLSAHGPYGAGGPRAQDKSHRSTQTALRWVILVSNFPGSFR